MKTLRLIVRSLARARLFSIAAVLTLALGLGAAAAAFSVIDAVLIRPLPYPDSDRLVVLRHSLIGIGIADAGQSLGTFYHYRHHSRTLASVAAYAPLSLDLADAKSAGGNGSSSDAERVSAADVSANFLSTLGVSPARGRGFVPADERPHTRVALISDDLWRRRYGGNEHILNEQVRLDGELYQIVGVMPRGFHSPDATTVVWRPLQLDSLTPHAGSFSLGGIARLAPGATPERAQAELNELLPRLPESYPDLFPTITTAHLLAQAKATAVVRSMRDAAVGSFARTLWVVAATVALLLVVTFTNVANLLLVRAQARSHELAVRSALGASRAHLVSRFFGEAGVLAAAGAAIGIVFAIGMLALLLRYGPTNFPRLQSVHADFATIAFTVLVALLATIACAALPAIRFRSAAINAFLRDGGRSASAGRARHRAQRTLIVVQVALAVVLLAGAGLLARTVQRLNSVKPGFDPSGTLAFTIALPQGQYARAGSIAAFYDDALQRIAALPGVTDAGVVSHIPLSGAQPLAAIRIESAPTPPNALPDVYPVTMASAGYFNAMHIALLTGRVFNSPRDPTDAHNVVVSREFAERYWHDSTGRAAIGQRVRAIVNDWATIVGVVASVRDTSLEAAPTGQIYLPLSVVGPDVPDSVAPFTPRVASVIVRTRGDPVALAASVRRVLHALDPGVPVFDVEPVTSVIERATARTRFVLMVLGAAAALTLVLGAIGLYGVIAYIVSLRTRELGLRLALGAEPRGVLALVLGQGLVLAGIGIVCGLVGFAGVARFLGGFLFGVAPSDPLTFAVVIATLLAVSAGASAIPAWRASRIDPLEALRAE